MNHEMEQLAQKIQKLDTMVTARVAIFVLRVVLLREMKVTNTSVKP